MARPSVYEQFLDVAAQVFNSNEFQTIKDELQGLGIDLRKVVMPMLELVIRTAALVEKPEVPYRQEMRHKALNNLVKAGFSADSILALIRKTRSEVPILA